MFEKGQWVRRVRGNDKTLWLHAGGTDRPLQVEECNGYLVALKGVGQGCFWVVEYFELITTYIDDKGERHYV